MLMIRSFNDLPNNKLMIKRIYLWLSLILLCVALYTHAGPIPRKLRNVKLEQPAMQIKVIGFNRVKISGNAHGMLIRKASGNIRMEYGLPGEDLKGKIVARDVSFPYIDSLPVSLSEITWNYTLEDRSGNIITEASTSTDQWPEEILPQLILPDRPGWVALYRKAWELNWRRMATSNAVPGHFAYKATPDNNMCYAWDVCFNTLFQRYAAMAGADPGVASLDDFYALQSKSGYIVRRFNTSTFEASYPSKDSPTVDGVNPPLFAWAEWNYYMISADKARLAKILPYLIKQYYFIESFMQQKPGKYIWNGNPSGWDNIMEVQKHKYWMELPAMQALSAGCIAKIAGVLRLEKTQHKFDAEIENKRTVMEQYWNEDKSWYCSLNAEGGFTGKTLNGMWPVLAGLVPTNRLKLMVAENLMDPQKFLTPMPLPVLAKDEAGYNPKGGYWHGSVWINMSLLTVRSLDQYGYHQEARELATRTLNGMLKVYNDWQPKRQTLWECYAPEFPAPASHKVKPELGSVRTDFADWTCCLINLIIEDIMGVSIDAPSNTITWSLNLNEENGLKNLRFGKVTTDILSKGLLLTVNTNTAYTLNVIRDGHMQRFEVKPGYNSFNISKI
jgi:hypothetical protein